jgi:hypothetical protein
MAALRAKSSMVERICASLMAFGLNGLMGDFLALADTDHGWCA